jgi:predicted dehydrogenase
MIAKSTIRFAVIGANHGHIYSQTEILLQAGAELAGFYIPESDLAEAFSRAFPDAHCADGRERLLEDPSIQLIVSAAVPAERAPLGIEVMRHAKDYMSDKPGFTSLSQLEEARRVQAETRRIYSIFFSERLGNPASVRAGELIQAGAIGRVLQTIGLGPHRLNLPARPNWFFRKERYGGILVDIASHQVDQFLFYSGSTRAEVLSAVVANYAHPQYPELEDFGEMLLRGDGGTGYMRVDWFTPDGLPVWGDGRLTILGTEGTIEIRKYIDPAGRPGDSHLFLTDPKGVEYIPCQGLPTPYGAQLLQDILERSETAVPQAQVFLASELALQAEAGATRLGFLSGRG